MMQHITLAGVKTAAKKAYDAGNLIAQNNIHEYFYRRGDICCAIGAALTPHTARAITLSKLNGCMVNSKSRIKGNYITDFITVSDDEMGRIRMIQLTHDDWNRAEVRLEKRRNLPAADPARKSAKENAKGHKRVFLKLIA